MSRFSPTVRDRRGDAIAQLASSFAGAVGNYVTLKRQSELDAERKRATDEERELRDLTLAKSGIHRGTAPAPISDEKYNAGMPKIGMAEGTSGSGLADNLEQYVGSRSQEPEVIALPGQYLRGQGVTKKAIIRTPPPPAIGLQDPTQRGDVSMEPRFKQLTPNFYEEVDETPEYRAKQEAEAADARRKVDLADMVGLMARAKRGDVDAQAALAARDPSLRDDYLFPKPDHAGETLEETKRHNREMEGIGRKRAERGGRGTGVGEDDDGVSGNQLLIARRQIAVQAASALSKLNPDNFSSPAAYTTAQQAIARNYGFDSAEELGRELKELRVRVSAGPKPKPDKGKAKGGTDDGSRVATDEDLAEITNAVGFDPAKVRAELKKRRLREQ